MLDLIVEFLSGIGRIFIGIFCLGLCVFVHELGHFLAARRRGLKVTRFSIGFGPRIWGWTRDGVDYRVSLIPFGGYVALPQLADMGGLEGDEEAAESFGNESEDLPKISYTDKMIVSVMGAVFNVLFAFVLSLGLWAAGQDAYLGFLDKRIRVADTVTTSEGVEITSPALNAGLQNGDVITHIDGVEVEDWGDIVSRIVLGVERTEANKPFTEITVDREGKSVVIGVEPILAGKEERRQVGIALADRIEVGDSISEALQESLQVGDRIFAVNGNKHFTRGDIIDKVRESEDMQVLFTFMREERLFDLPVTVKLEQTEAGNEIFNFGFAMKLQSKLIYPNPVTQFADKMEQMYLTLRGLLHRGSNIGLDDMSGPVGIIDNFQEMARYGPKALAWLLVFVNINLAIMNLLPIPVLDGGHMTFATLAKLRGKQLPRKFMENVQVAFAMFLFSFIIYVTFFDVGRAIDKISLWLTQISG